MKKITLLFILGFDSQFWVCSNVFTDGTLMIQQLGRLFNKTVTTMQQQ